MTQRYVSTVAGDDKYLMSHWGGSLWFIVVQTVPNNSLIVSESEKHVRLPSAHFAAWFLQFSCLLLCATFNVFRLVVVSFLSFSFCLFTFTDGSYRQVSITPFSKPKYHTWIFSLLSNMFGVYKRKKKRKIKQLHGFPAHTVRYTFSPNTAICCW